MKALRITGWSRFEKSDHKKCKNMTWVATPTSHDGIGFLRLLTSPEGLRRYGGWHLILQVAAKCPVHGLLVSDAGRPLGATEIALKTRANEADINDAIQACCEIGWLETVEIPDAAPELSGEAPQSSCLQDRTRQDKTGEDRTPGAVDPLAFMDDTQTPPQPQPAEPPTGTDDALWRYQIGAQPWVRALKRAGAKIGPNNWRTWQGLIDRAFAGNAEACAAAAARVSPDDRWPDRVEKEAQPNQTPDPLASKYAGRQTRTVQVTP